MKILIAEDEADLLSQYKDILEQNNHQVLTTSDGEECLLSYRKEYEKWFQNKNDDSSPDAPFDVLILDYQMPKKNGLDVAKEIISIVPKQRIIFASGFVENTLQDSIKTLKKIVELMQKPFALQALVDTIEDKEIYRELEKLNVDIKNLKELEPSHAQVRDYLDALKKIQKGRTF
jgi:DNA-binding response OmpR family regulator